MSLYSVPEKKKDCALIHYFTWWLLRMKWWLFMHGVEMLWSLKPNLIEKFSKILVATEIVKKVKELGKQKEG